MKAPDKKAIQKSRALWKALEMKLTAQEIEDQLGFNNSQRYKYRSGYNCPQFDTTILILEILADKPLLEIILDYQPSWGNDGLRRKAK